MEISMEKPGWMLVPSSMVGWEGGSDARGEDKVL
jgi:hypothetical protein